MRRIILIVVMSIIVMKSIGEVIRSEVCKGLWMRFVMIKICCRLKEVVGIKVLYILYLVR